MSNSNPILNRVSTMSNDIKSGVGYIIPASAVLGFFVAMFSGAYILSISVAVFGILGWFVYMLVVESKPPSLLGNLIILFGVLLSVGVFMAYGVTQNMWGGMEFKTEGLLISLVVLFFSILTGMLFRGQLTSEPSLNNKEQDIVRQALEKAGETSTSEPRVIVVKQEQETPKVVQDEKKEEKKDVDAPQNPYGYDPYAYAYPEDYYDDDEYDEEYDEDDEWEEDEDEEDDE